MPFAKSRTRATISLRPFMSSERFLNVLILFLLFLLFIYPLSASEQYSSSELLLLYNEIASSSLYELQQRATFLKLDFAKETETLRADLFNYYGIVKEDFLKPIEELKSEDLFEIIKSDKLYKVGSPTTFVILEGGVELSFKGENPLTLSAEKVVLDLNNKRASALGNVSYQDEKDYLEGQILTLNWQEQTFYLSEGYTKMVREGEKQEFEFYTIGSTFSYNPSQGTLLFKDSVITTNKENAYFSISSKNLFIIEGGDFFVTSAKLKMGHVPVLYLPFFFYPSKTFVFNPAFGFEFERGWFFNSTSELYGRYPKIVSSNSAFGSLLKNTKGENLFKDGWTYTQTPSGKTESALEKWAQQSNSYMALLVDVYQNRGLFGAIESENNLFDKRLKIGGFASLAYNNQQSGSLSSVYPINTFRYGIKQNSSLDTKWVKMALDIEYYSDVRFLRDYFNRLTSFNLDFLQGESNIEKNYLSDITKLEWSFRLSATVPTDKLKPYIEELRINNLNAKIVWKAQKIGEQYPYVVDQLVLPDLAITTKGTLIDFKQKGTVIPKTEKKNTLNNEVSFLDLEPLFEPLVEAKKEPQKTSSYFNLSYNINQIYKNNSEQLAQNLGKNSQYYRLNFPLTLKGALKNSIITFQHKVTPLFLLNSDEKEKNSLFNINLTTDISSKPLGLTYGLTNQLYNLSVKEELNQNPIISGGYQEWNSESVKRHFITFSWPFNIKKVTIEPTVTTTLKPLDLKITPQIGIRYSFLSLLGSYSLVENESGFLKGEDLNLKLAYIDSKNIEILFDSTYQGQEKNVVLKHTLKLNTFSPYFKFSDSFTYDFSKTNFDQFSLTGSTKWASLSLSGSGKIEKPQIDLLEATINVDNLEKYWWKERIFLSVQGELSYRHHFFDSYQSLFSFKISSQFAIAEFIDLSFSLTTVNRSFHRYSNFKEMWEDLMNSFDFFGEGRKQSQFSMESVEFGLIHYMADWTLHCKYQASVVLSDLKWKWQPVFTIYLQWKAFDEIKVERDFNL